MEEVVELVGGGGAGVLGRCRVGGGLVEEVGACVRGGLERRA